MMSLRPSERVEVRRRRYKVAVDAEEGRRPREDKMVEIRKSRREESLLKKRRDGLPPAAAAAGATPQMAHSTALQQKLEGLPAMVQAVLSDDSAVQLEATTQFRKLPSIARDLLFPLLQQLNEHAKLSMLRNATWTLSNFCRGKLHPNFEQVKPALSALQRLIHSQNEEVRTDACWALSYLSDGTNDKIQAVIESGVFPRLVELLMHPSASVLIPALRTVGNIVTGDDMQTQSEVLQLRR